MRSSESFAHNPNDEDVIPVLPKCKMNKKKDWERVLNPRIPQPPFTVAIVGPRHTGKTVLAHHLISKRKGMYGTYFNKANTILYSPTYSCDDTLHDLKLEKVYGPKHDVLNIVEDIIRQQEVFKKSNDEAPVFIILEDCTQIRKAWIALEKLGYTGRHFQIHTLAIAHKMSSIPRGVRTQIQQWILFRPHEQSEWDWVLGMFSRRSRDAQKIWMNALRRAWNIEYNFVYIDFERKGFENIYRSSFNQPLFSPQEQNVLENGADEVFYDPEFEMGSKASFQDKAEGNVEEEENKENRKVKRKRGNALK